MVRQQISGMKYCFDENVFKRKRRPPVAHTCGGAEGRTDHSLGGLANNGNRVVISSYSRKKQRALEQGSMIS